MVYSSIIRLKIQTYSYFLVGLFSLLSSTKAHAGLIVPEYEDSTTHIIVTVGPNLYNFEVALSIAAKAPSNVLPVFLVSTPNNLTEISDKIREKIGNNFKTITSSFQTTLVWTRDYVPVTIKSLDQKSVSLWSFTYGQGARRISHLPADNIAQKDAELGAVRLKREFVKASQIPYFDSDIKLDGGNIAINHAGLCLTTSRILEQDQFIEDEIFPGLNGVYPKVKSILLTEQQAKKMMTESGLCKDLLILEPLLNESTRHVDLFVKYVDEKTVLMSTPDGINKELLERNQARLVAAGLKVIELPFPQNIDNIDAVSYTNSLIINGVAIIPKYADLANQPADQFIRLQESDSKAIEVYRSLGFRTETIQVYQLAQQGGAIHCVTQDLHMEKFSKDNSKSTEVQQKTKKAMTTATSLIEKNFVSSKIVMLGQAGHYTNTAFNYLIEFLEKHKNDLLLRAIPLEVSKDLDQILVDGSIGKAKIIDICNSIGPSTELAYIYNYLLPVVQKINKNRPAHAKLYLRAIDGAVKNDSPSPARKVEEGSCYSRFRNKNSLDVSSTFWREQGSARNMRALIKELPESSKLIGVYHMAHLARGIEVCGFDVNSADPTNYISNWGHLSWADFAGLGNEMKTLFIDEPQWVYHPNGVFNLTAAVADKTSKNEFAFMTSDVSDALSSKGLRLFKYNAYLRWYIDTQNKSDGKLSDITDGIIYFRDGVKKNGHKSLSEYRKQLGCQM